MTYASVEVHGGVGACIRSMGHGDQELCAERTGRGQSGHQTQGFGLTTTQLRVSCLGSKPKEMVLLDSILDGLVGDRLWLGPHAVLPLYETCPARLVVIQLLQHMPETQDQCAEGSSGTVLGTRASSLCGARQAGGCGAES